jgi:hypothetical protein
MDSAHIARFLRLRVAADAGAEHPALHVGNLMSTFVSAYPPAISFGDYAERLLCTCLRRGCMAALPPPQTTTSESDHAQHAARSRCRPDASCSVEHSSTTSEAEVANGACAAAVNTGCSTACEQRVHALHREYAESARAGRCTEGLLACMYIDRIQHPIHPLAAHRILLASVLVASKFLNDGAFPPVRVHVPIPGAGGREPRPTTACGFIPEFSALGGVMPGELAKLEECYRCSFFSCLRSWY